MQQLPTSYLGTYDSRYHGDRTCFCFCFHLFPSVYPVVRTASALALQVPRYALGCGPCPCGPVGAGLANNMNRIRPRPPPPTPPARNRHQAPGTRPATEFRSMYVEYVSAQDRCFRSWNLEVGRVSTAAYGNLERKKQRTKAGRKGKSKLNCNLCMGSWGIGELGSWLRPCSTYSAGMGLRMAEAEVGTIYSGYSRRWSWRWRRGGLVEQLICEVACEGEINISVVKPKFSPVRSWPD